MTIESNCVETIALIMVLEGKIGGSFDFVKSSLFSIPPLLKRTAQVPLSPTRKRDISGIVHNIGKGVTHLRRNVEELLEIMKKKQEKEEIHEEERKSFDKWGAVFVDLKSQILLKMMIDVIHSKHKLSGVYSENDAMGMVLSKGAKMIWEATVMSPSDMEHENDLIELAKFALVSKPFMESETCCAYACECLQRRCFLRYDPLVELSRNGTPRIVCNLLGKYRSCGLFVKHAIALLCQLAREGTVPKEEMIRSSSFFHLIVDVIKIHVNNVIVIEQSGWLLCSLSELEEFRSLVLASEILPLLTTIASKYENNDQVMKTLIVGFLTNLAESSHWIGQIATHGLHLRVFGYIKECLMNSDLDGISMSFHFVKNMSVSPILIMTDLFEMDVIPMLLDGVEKMDGAASVTYPGCAALCNIFLGMYPSCRESADLNYEEIIHFLIKVMEKNENNIFVLTCVVSLFRVLVQYSKHETILLNNNVFRKLACLLKTHATSQFFATRCLGFFWDLSHESYVARSGMYTYDMVDAITMCMRYHQKNKEIMFRSLSVLGNFLYDGKECVHSDCAYTSLWVIESSKVYSRDETMMGCICKILLLLGNGKSVVAKSTIIQNGAIEWLESAKEDFRTNELFSEQIPMTVKSLMQHKEERGIELH
eukprot:TRINITY_DN8616_c0_g1_i1.p1 TRINITY_DN8616_c0_g1~~TRINITY_DN8616_c0_g1_i1.p1  ORF type:complete len:662 (+),score=157.13 TRINITY_DN8616_c0_g1_i1:35-1987(+)